MFKFFLIASALFLVSEATAQEMKVTGTVYDTTGTIPLRNALAMAIRVKDSLLLDFTRTDAQGRFEISGFEVDTFSLIISHPNSDEKTYYMFGAADNFDINIPRVVMPPKSQEIAEVVIYAYKDPIYYKGDTLVYVADSFAVDENAVVEDLLKKLPGITVDKDGKITSQGEDISKVLVDGDEFFGSDPTIATKNLGANGIETVQVYEKENDEGIGGDDEKIKVLDLKLKEDAKKGYFGRVSGASDFALTPIGGEIGTNPFYEGEALFNVFNGSQKISFFALGSNTPRSSFGWGDLNKFGLENESGTGNRWNPGSGNNTSGIPTTLKGGFYYSDKLGEKKQTKVGFNYSFYRDELDARSASRSQFLLPDTSYITDDSTRDYALNISHRINLNIETQLDSLTSIQIKPNISFNSAQNSSRDISDFFNTSGAQTIGTNVRDTTGSEGIELGGFARVTRKFMKPKRELEVRYDISLSDNKNNGFLDSYTTYIASPFPNDTISQRKYNDNKTLSHYGTFTYVEPLGAKWRAQVEYLLEYGTSFQDKVALDFNSGAQDYIDTNAFLTNVFDNIRQQHRVGLMFIYEPKKHRFAGEVRVRNIAIQNINRVTDSEINQNFTNFLPTFEYRFRPSMSKQFRVNYRTSSQQPSINDLQPIPDNTNPNRIKLGNPNLRPNYVHSFNTMFNSWKALSGRYVWAGANVILTQDAFGDSTNYDSFGRAVSQTVNVKGNTIASVYSGAGLPILGRKIEFAPGINGSYYRATNFIGAVENITENFSVTPNLKITFRFINDSLEMYTENSYAYNNTLSSFNNSTTPYYTLNNEVGFKWRMKGGFTIGSDGAFTKNFVPGDGFFDTQFFVLNAEVSKKFLKTQNLEVAIIGNDILNQNINARREVIGTTITDYRTTIISRYFLLKVTLRFNNRRAKEDDFDMFH